jgi:hypothetical protein
MPEPVRPQTITFADLREQGVRGLLIYCADYRRSHSIAISSDRLPDDLRLSDIELRFTCTACGERGADGRTAIFKPVTSLCRGPTQRSHHKHSPHRHEPRSHGNLGSHGIRDRLAARRCQGFPCRKDGTWRD